MKPLLRPICFFEGLFNLLTTGKNISGHPFKETAEDKDSQTLECQRCGYVSIGYYRDSGN